MKGRRTTGRWRLLPSTELFRSRRSANDGSVFDHAVSVSFCPPRRAGRAVSPTRPLHGLHLDQNDKGNMTPLRRVSRVLLRPPMLDLTCVDEAPRRRSRRIVVVRVKGSGTPPLSRSLVKPVSQQSFPRARGATQAGPQSRSASINDLSSSREANKCGLAFYRIK